MSLEQFNDPRNRSIEAGTARIEMQGFDGQTDPLSNFLRIKSPEIFERILEDLARLGLFDSPVKSVARYRSDVELDEIFENAQFLATRPDHPAIHIGIQNGMYLIAFKSGENVEMEGPLVNQIKGNASHFARKAVEEHNTRLFGLLNKYLPPLSQE